MLSHLCTMRPKAIPYQHDGRVQLTQKDPQKVNNQAGVDVAVGMESEVEMKLVARWRHTKRGYDRDFLMPPGTLIEDGCLPSRRPRAANQRGHKHPTLVEEDQPCVQPRRFFLMRGHSCLTQPRMRSSLRSIARRCGFCGLHPSERSTRPIWST